MTVYRIKKLIAEIKKQANKFDHERAHGLEDELYIKVLTAIAQGEPNAQKLAKAALKSQRIKFFRFTA
jgi:hypothetical protein